MNPYCKIQIEEKKFRGPVYYHGGKHPTWDDRRVVPREHERFCQLELRDKNKLTRDSKIGEISIDLEAVAALGRVTRWYNVVNKDRIEEKILLAISYTPN